MSVPRRQCRGEGRLRPFVFGSGLCYKMAWIDAGPKIPAEEELNGIDRKRVR